MVCVHHHMFCLILVLCEGHLDNVFVVSMIPSSVPAWVSVPFIVCWCRFGPLISDGVSDKV